MPRLLGIFVLLALALPALAVANEPAVDGYYSGRIVVTDHADGMPAQPGAGVGGAEQTVYSYWAVVYTPVGFCRERRYTTDQAEADAYNYSYVLQTAEINELTRLDTCPDDTPTVAPPSPGELARDFWDVRHLSSPVLKTVPDDAIVGKRVYLQIGGPPNMTFDVPNPLGVAIAIEATSRYVVDWGDGSPPTTTTSQGGPWPHGDVTHVYDTATPAATIRVTQHWSAAWTAGRGAAGTLENLQTIGELIIRVDQLQPVRNR
jgi:hypothetical protein